MTKQEQVAEFLKQNASRIVYVESTASNKSGESLIHEVRSNMIYRNIAEEIHRIYTPKMPVYTLEQIANDPELLKKLR